MKESTFAGKFISKLEKIGRDQIESYLRRLLKERSFFEQVFQTLVEGIVVTDMESRIVYINKAAHKLLGISLRQNLLGEPLVKVISDTYLLQKIRDFELPEDNRVQSCDISVRYPRPAVYLLKILPLHEEDSGETSSLVFIISDISETRKKEIERFRQQRLESLATLTAGIAHEIKNPLNALSIHAQLLKHVLEEETDAFVHESKEYARIEQSTDIILEEIRRLTRIVNQFITSVRPFKLQIKYRDITTLVEDVMETVLPDADKRGVDIQINPMPDLPMILVDEHLIRQALMNIIINALESVEEGKGKVTISTSCSEKWLFITISDNGKGMTDSEVERMFEPYFTTKETGSGLGLFIVYRIIHEHRGEIQIESEPGEGTTFIIKLPLLKRPTRYLPEQHAKAGDNE